MSKVFLNVDVDSIDTTKKVMDNDCDELLTMFNTFKTKIEETKDVYDTESATLYREIGALYTDLAIKYLNNDFKPYITALNDIKGIYDNAISELSDSVNGGE